VLVLAAGAALPAGAAAKVKTGQSPECTRFCMSVEPREGPEGSVFRFRGHGWRPNGRVAATYGVYCRPNEACIEIAYIVRLRTDRRGRFAFRLRAGDDQPDDAERGIHAGDDPTFSQRTRTRTVSRTPRYRVIMPG
jgi:hypothetical protein